MKKIIIFLLLLLIPSTFATLEDNLTAFYEFNGNGTDKANSYDATSIVGVTEALASDCKRNTCYNFDGTTSDLIKLPSAIVNNKQEGTLNVWVRVQDTGSVQRNLFAKDSAGFRSQLASTNNRKPYFLSNSDGYLYSGVEIANDNWSMITFTWNTTHKKIFIDGSNAVEHTSSAPYETTNSNGDLFLGQNSVNTNEVFKGYLDELAVWGRVLTDSEITSLFSTINDTDYIISSVVSSDPTINLISPADVTSYYNYTSSVDLEFNVTGVNSTYDCGIYVNDSLVYSNSSVINNTNMLYSYSVNPSENYNWYVTCNNINSSVRTFDTTTLQSNLDITINTPTNSETFTTDSVFFNITTNSTVDSCSISYGTGSSDSGLINTFGVITDIHNTKFTTHNSAVRGYERMNMYYNQALTDGATYLINLGDNVYEVTDHDQQIEQLEFFELMWSNFSLPSWSTVGNHDVNTLTQPEVTKQELLTAWNGSLNGNDYYYVDYNNVRHVFLNSMYGSDGSFGYHNGVGGHIHPDQLAWLNETVIEASNLGYYVIVQTHFLLDTDTNGIVNRGEVNKILYANNDTVIAVLQGDTHASAYSYQAGIHHVTFYSPVLHTYDPENYATIKLYNDTINILGYGDVISRNLAINSQAVAKFNSPRSTQNLTIYDLGQNTYAETTLTNLSDGVYNYSITCDDGITNKTTNNYTFTIASVPTELIISSVSSSSITNVSASISWTTNELSNSTLYYSTESNNLSNVVLDSNNVTSHQINLNNLLNSTTYYYKVLSYYNSTLFNESSVFNFTTSDTQIVQEPPSEPPTTSSGGGGGGSSSSGTSSSTYVKEAITIKEPEPHPEATNVVSTNEDLIKVLEDQIQQQLDISNNNLVVSADEPQPEAVGNIDVKGSSKPPEEENPHIVAKVILSALAGFGAVGLAVKGKQRIPRIRTK